ncbi:MAG: hypothetical protein COT14_02635 [Candidatus Diapherotrites archaeon CG08_land_8_20_14_0_20_30_16]|nr:MAG: hypothetical protein COT14_02635 [Candidatus Diapherotrites archaeon CG08_land_8_20_14_0_20_30_16]
MLNITSKKKIKKFALKIKYAKTVLQQTKGLMFLFKGEFDFGLIFPFKQKNRFLNSIHMFFVFFPICAVFLNSKKRVVDKKILKPFTPIYIPKKDCSFLIELPIKYSKKIKTGDKIYWQEK